MTITSKKPVRTNKFIVDVPVSDLSYVDLEKGASVAGEGYLNFKNLTVFVNIDCKMDLEVPGDINIKQAQDCDFIYQKNETTKVFYIRE